ncbi:hypothetical protein [Flavobacterium tegetincola]|uniref:hypothetical protein n=1 Tax=Flavobacterium tegetincola TaxID=150172 RepID=UPI000424E96C|nr:hypothetical protein [Flavobacterium tegetincola]
MEYKICLSKTTVIFYALLCLIIVYASIANLLSIIDGTGNVIGLGAFSLGGFVLLPLMVFFTYRNNLCTVKADGVKIGKHFYPLASYQFSIVEYKVAFKDRPLFSLLKKTKETFIVKRKGEQQVYFQEDLAIFNRDIKKLKEAIQQFN